MPDQPTALERTVGFVTLLRALCEAVLDQPPVPYEPGARGFYQQNRWAASRFGLDAELSHPNGERAAPASELAAELIELAGDGATLDLSRTEADRQLEVGRSQGLEAVCADLVERTLS